MCKENREVYYTISTKSKFTTASMSQMVTHLVTGQIRISLNTMSVQEPVFQSEISIILAGGNKVVIIRGSRCVFWL